MQEQEYLAEWLKIEGKHETDCACEVSLICTDQKYEIFKEVVTKLLAAQRAELVEKVTKEIVGITAIIESSIRDTGQVHIAEMKLETILALLTPTEGAAPLPDTKEE